MDNTIHGRVRTSQKVNGNIKSSSTLSAEISTDVKNRTLKDYDVLINKPQFEGIEWIGNKHLSDFGIPYVFFGTVEYWAEQPSLITIKDAVYVYEDYYQNEQGENIPGIKIGDGLGYLIDAPFINNGEIYEHINNLVIHVTQEEKNSWNNKVRCYLDVNNLENLVFTTN